MDVKIKRVSTINIIALLYEIADVNPSDCFKEREGGYLYFAESGKNLNPSLIFSFTRLPLGIQKLYFKKGTPSQYVYPLVTYRQAYSISNADPVIRKKTKERLVEDENGFKRRLERAEKQGSKKDVEDVLYETPTLTKAVERTLKSEDINCYTVTQAVELEEIKKLQKEELDLILHEYISGGYEIAPELYSIMKAGLISFTPEEKNKKLMKYRPHALIIKPPKSGVSSISDRIGKNVDNMSIKNVEGYADAEGHITHSTLHDTWTHVNIDEFLQMKEFLLQHMFNYLEVGQFVTHKAGREIINYGAPRICFTANPQDIEGLDFNSVRGAALEIDGKLHLDESRRHLMYSVFKSSLDQLTQVSNAAFSRLGVVLFKPELQTAQKVTDKDYTYFEQIDGIAKAILYNLSGPATQIFYELEGWLNKPLPEYEKKLKEILKQCDQSLIKNAFLGHKDGFRHIRGHALSEAIIDNAHQILLDGITEQLLAKIKEDVEANLQYITRVNLDSLIIILLSSEQFENDPETLRTELALLKTKYFKPFVIGGALGTRKILGNENNDVISGFPDFLKVCGEIYDSLPKEIKEQEFGERYIYWSRVTECLNREVLKRNFGLLFKKPLFLGDKIILYNDVSEKVLNAFSEIRKFGNTDVNSSSVTFPKVVPETLKEGQR